MVQHARLIFYSLLLLVIPCESTLAQKIPVTPIDSLITVGYATGSLKTLSGSVEKITETQMNKDQITNPLEAIRGRVPGLTIQRGSNGPAALDAVRLRGTTSLTSGNDPLIIVDGVFGDLSMLTSIYPTDIESFTILKDASETAQYGSRGASGVIEVTTKKGMSGRTQVAYNGSFGISTVYKNLKMLSGDEYRRIASERGISILDKGYNTDFQKEIEQTGLQQNHHIAFYGGSSESSYRVSLGFMDRQGVILNEDMKNFTSNMNMNQKMFDGFLNCELGMFGSIQKNHNLVDYQKTFYSAATFNPTYPNHKDPVTNSWDGITTASQITNPLAWMEVQDDDATSHISTHARLTFNLLEGLKLNLFGAYTYNIVENSQYLPTSVWANGQAYKGTKKRESLLGNMMLTYKKNWKKHFFDVLALAELQKETYTGYYTTVSNFSTDKFGYNNLQAGALRLWEGTNSYYDQPRLASFMGRFNYTYADRYVLTLNARTDASSKFGANHKWGFFPSASAAWVISEEEFMKQLPMVDNLKFRIGYGLAGNQSGIDSYTTLNLVKPNGVVPVGNSAVVSLGDLRNTNPDLKWEANKTFNMGVDLGFLNQRITISPEFYINRSSNLLLNAQLPYSSGYQSMLINAGETKNVGVELTVNTVNFSTKKFSWNTTLTLSHNKNSVKALTGEAVQLYEAKFGFNQNTHRIAVGEPLGQFYGYITEGLYQVDDFNYDASTQTYTLKDGVPYHGDKGQIRPGMWKFKNLTGDDNVIDENDKTVIGNAQPKFYGGLNNSFTYKGFDLSIFLTFSYGNEVLNATKLVTSKVGSLNYNALDVMNSSNRWMTINSDGQKVTDPGELAALNVGKTVAAYHDAQQGDNYIHSWAVEDASYLKLSNVTLGYTFPKNLIARVGLKNLRLYATGNNLLTWTKYSGFDPEVSTMKSGLTPGVDFGAYPLSRSFIFGLNVAF